MAMFKSLLAFLALLASITHAMPRASPYMKGFQSAVNLQRERLSRHSEFFEPSGSSEANSAPPRTVTFSNPAAKKFEVDGTKIPDGIFKSVNSSELVLLAHSHLERGSFLVRFDAYFKCRERKAKTLLLVRVASVLVILRVK
jgi:hypothetical protein